MANRRAAASNSANGKNLVEGPANLRKALALNEKQLAANHCNELFASQVGAAGFEPTTLLTPRNERAFRNKPTLVKERVVVRHCEATSHRAVAFGLEESARWPHGVPNLADIKERTWGAHCLQFRGPSSLPMELLGFERSLAKYPKSYSNSFL